MANNAMLVTPMDETARSTVPISQHKPTCTRRCLKLLDAVRPVISHVCTDVAGSFPFPRGHGSTLSMQGNLCYQIKNMPCRM